MDIPAIMDRFARLYPGRPVVRLPAHDPTEIICELTSAVDDPGHGVATAVIDRSVPHLHRQTRERYTVIDGSACVWVDGTARTLMPGETIDIEPNQVHCVEADAVWLQVDSWPGWTSEDHILCPDTQFASAPPGQTGAARDRP